MRSNFTNGETTTKHRLYQGDARNFAFLADESVHLVVTSPPYWKLKRYNENAGQLGHVLDYEEFLDDLKHVWAECYRVLVPGGRLVCVVGDVCLSRKENGRHVVVPLHADICVICRKLGFDNLNPIIWHKISNAAFRQTRAANSSASPTSQTPSSKMISSSFSCNANLAAIASLLKSSGA